MVAEPGCIACTWHGINIWSRFSWDLIETIPGLYPLVESIKFCGLTSVPVVRVCGCGSERAGRDRLRFQPWAAGLGWGLQRREGPKPPLMFSPRCSQALCAAEG